MWNPKLTIKRTTLSETSMLLGHPMAWYNPETNEIIIDKRLKPLYLVLIHELGHYFIGYIPQAIHLIRALDYEWDELWIKLNLDRLWGIASTEPE